MCYLVLGKKERKKRIKSLKRIAADPVANPVEAEAEVRKGRANTRKNILIVLNQVVVLLAGTSGHNLSYSFLELRKKTNPRNHQYPNLN